MRKVYWWQRRRFFRMAALLCYHTDTHTLSSQDVSRLHYPPRSACGVCWDEARRNW